MRVAAAILLSPFLLSCSAEKRDTATSAPETDPTEQSDSLADWIAAWETQKSRFGGEEPDPHTIRETGRRVYYLKAERASDTRRRFYSLRIIHDERWELYESFGGIMERLASWDDSAAIFYTPPDTGAMPSFTYTEFAEIQKTLDDKGHELILHTE